MQNKTSISATDMESNFSNASLGKKEIKRLDTPCCLHIHSRRYRLTDPDGVSAKAAIDGIVLSGLLQNDTTKEIKEITYSQEKVKKADFEETIITISFGC